MKYLKFSPFILLSLCLMGCPDKDDEMDSEITIVNNSNKSLIMNTDNRNYPDTTIWLGGSPFDQVIRDRFTIKPNSIHKQKGKWKRFFGYTETSDVLMIYLYDTAVLDTVPWNKIKEDYLIARRYDLTLKQLDSLNWTITYP